MQHSRVSQHPGYSRDQCAKSPPVVVLLREQQVSPSVATTRSPPHLHYHLSTLPTRHSTRDSTLQHPSHPVSPAVAPVFLFHPFLPIPFDHPEYSPTPPHNSSIASWKLRPSAPNTERLIAKHINQPSLAAATLPWPPHRDAVLVYAPPSAFCTGRDLTKARSGVWDFLSITTFKSKSH